MTISLEDALSLLPDRLRATLALLHPAGDDLIALALGTLPAGSRALLAALGAIELGGPAHVRLTPFGRDVVAACALEGVPQGLADKACRLEEALAREAAGSRRAGEPRDRPDTMKLELDA